MQCFGSIACSAAAVVGLAACLTPPDRDALRERWHSDEPRAKSLPKAAPWLELAAPSDGLALAAVVPLVEVRGRAGRGAHGPQDVVVTIDTSGSVFVASGIDLDGNGVVGQMRCSYDCASFPANEWTSDFADIVLKVEIDAAQKLLAQLDPATTRAGMVKFGDTPYVERAVGSLADLSETLSHFRYVMRGGTDIVTALHQSIDLLEAAPPVGGVAPQRAILLLTDGEIAVPDWSEFQHHDYLHGLLVRARAAQVRIFSFGIGELATRHTDLLDALAVETGGAFVEVPASRDIALELQLLGLTGLADVEVRNATERTPGRAVRVFPDGSFDGYAPLAEGDNDIEVTATLADGTRVVGHRRVSFHEPASPTREQLVAAEALAAALRERSLTTELSTRVEAERRRRARELKIAPE